MHTNFEARPACRVPPQLFWQNYKLAAKFSTLGFTWREHTVIHLVNSLLLGSPCWKLHLIRGRINCDSLSKRISSASLAARVQLMIYHCACGCVPYMCRHDFWFAFCSCLRHWLPLRRKPKQSPAHLGAPSMLPLRQQRLSK